MANRRPERYRLAFAGVMYEITKQEFDVAVIEGFAVQSEKDRRLAHVAPRYRIYFDRQTSRLRVEVANPAERDRYAIRSWLGVLLERLSLYAPVSESDNRKALTVRPCRRRRYSFRQHSRGPDAT